MRLRIRTLLLTVALLSTITSTASACCLLDPFHWLFGCGCGPCYSNGGYGYGGYGPPQGYAPGYGGYQPAYPGVMSSCAPCAPLCPIVSIFRMPRCLPMPTIFQQCLDPCGMQQCAAPMMQPSVMPYQPAMMPMMQMQPMDMGCDGDCGGPEQMMSGMNAPMMDMSGMHGMASEGDCCGDDSMMGYGGSQPMMQSWSPSQPMMAWSPQGVYPGVGVPTKSYHSSLPPKGYGMFARPRLVRRDARRAAHQYRRMNAHQFRRMSAHPGYAPMGYPNAGMMPMSYDYQQPTYQPMGQQSMYPQSGYSEPGFGQAAAQGYSAPMNSAQYYRSQSYSTMPTAMMHSQMMPTNSAWNPQTTWTAQPSARQMSAQMPMMPSQTAMASDIMGDHEVPTSTAAMAPVVPNSYHGASPFHRATLSRPVLSTYGQYSKSVR